MLDSTPLKITLLIFWKIMLEGSVPVAGVVVGAFAWLQTKTGLGVITYNLGMARVARGKGGLWFVGALGRWYGPFPLKAMAAAMHLVSVERLLAGACAAVTQVPLLPEPSFCSTFSLPCLH